MQRPYLRPLSSKPLCLLNRTLNRDVMALAVLNYPTLSRDDFEWIQPVRRRHDPLYLNIVDPHFALVFPTNGVSQQTLIEHVRRQVGASVAFEIVFRCAILGDPDFQEHAHAFLVPDEGFSDIVRLHDRLYTGPLFWKP